MPPVLYLIPNILSDNTFERVLPQHVLSVTGKIRHFFVEDVRTARRFLSKIQHPVPIDRLHFCELSEHTSEGDVASFLPYLQAEDSGMISEAGVPGVADPGAALVKLAHDNGIRVAPLAGPSSVLMALMASGLNGQSFAFNGYLPVKQNERIARIRALEHRSENEGQTQIFIETPYRNMKLLEDIVTTCKPETYLCIAANITADDEYIVTQAVRKWKNRLPELHKIPAVFLLQAPHASAKNQRR
ncbi:MAG: SAM-dependent methyltransferase [Bacteroidales bacterium]|jgi:16S rRNA (cytidine1402-2'-O)-methyltransferase|nr:SAM-dependent methyltransferase [Bacteroidales bacterium]